MLSVKIAYTFLQIRLHSCNNHVMSYSIVSPAFRLRAFAKMKKKKKKQQHYSATVPDIESPEDTTAC